MSAFTDYIQSYIGGLSGTFGWGQAVLDFINTEALEAYGVSTEADATDSVKAHALLRYKAVERMLVDASGDVDYKSDGESFSRSQLFEHLNKMQAKALCDYNGETTPTNNLECKAEEKMACLRIQMVR